MNDLEIIEHWNIRESIFRWSLAVAAMIVVNVIFFAALPFFASPWFWLFWSHGVTAFLLCVWRLRRLVKRLRHLEQFVP